MSVGTEEIQPVLLAAVNKTVTVYNMPIVAAAGNAGSDACTNSPARSPYVTSVGASDMYDKRADFSNYGKCVNVNAIGVNVKGAGINCYNCSRIESGTSQAAPIVTGIVAQLLHANPDLTWTDIIDYWAISYVRNDSTNARIVQAPPLQRVFSERYTGNSVLKTFCKAPAFVPGLT